MLQGQNETLNMALGENIRRLRRDKHWTQGELADKSGVKVGHISKLERNEADPKLETLYKIMDALQCSPNALLNDVQKTSLDGQLEMVIERLQALPEDDKQTLLRVIDKYCIAVSVQEMMEDTSKGFLGIGRFLGKTEEMGRD